jgi:hypothetical protein
MRVDALGYPVRLVALARTELSRGSFPADELCAALSARERAARETVTLGSPRLEAFAASPAVTKETAVGEASPHRVDEFGRITPDLVVRFGMVRAAERDEVRERVGFVVAGEQPERPDVVDGDAVGGPALDAPAFVALERGAALLRPGRSSVSRLTAAPGWVLGSIQARHNVQSIWEVG